MPKLTAGKCFNLRQRFNLDLTDLKVNASLAHSSFFVSSESADFSMQNTLMVAPGLRDSLAVGWVWKVGFI